MPKYHILMLKSKEYHRFFVLLSEIKIEGDES